MKLNHDREAAAVQERLQEMLKPRTAAMQFEDLSELFSAQIIELDEAGIDDLIGMMEAYLDGYKRGASNARAREEKYFDAFVNGTGTTSYPWNGPTKSTPIANLRDVLTGKADGRRPWPPRFGFMPEMFVSDENALPRSLYDRFKFEFGNGSTIATATLRKTPTGGPLPAQPMLPDYPSAQELRMNKPATVDTIPGDFPNVYEPCTATEKVLARAQAWGFRTFERIGGKGRRADFIRLRHIPQGPRLDSYGGRRAVQDAIAAGQDFAWLEELTEAEQEARAKEIVQRAWERGLRWVWRQNHKLHASTEHPGGSIVRTHLSENKARELVLGSLRQGQRFDWLFGPTPEENAAQFERAKEVAGRALRHGYPRVRKHTQRPLEVVFLKPGRHGVAALSPEGLALIQSSLPHQDFDAISFKTEKQKAMLAEAAAKEQAANIIAEAEAIKRRAQIDSIIDKAQEWGYTHVSWVATLRTNARPGFSRGPHAPGVGTLVESEAGRNLIGRMLDEGHSFEFLYRGASK